MRFSNSFLLQRLPGIAVPVLVMAFSASLAKLVWMVFEPPQDVSAAPVSREQSPIVNQRALNLGRIIADNHLFGEVKRRPVPIKKSPVATNPPPKPAKTVAPPLALNLHGLWAKKRSDGRTEASFKALPLHKADDIVAKISMDLDALFGIDTEKKDATQTAQPAEPTAKIGSFAIMSHSGGHQQMYKEGDSIAEGVKLTEIFVDKVVVENRGVRQEISLSEGKNTTASTPAPATATKRPTPSRTTRPRRSAGKAVSANIMAGQHRGIPTERSSSRRRSGHNLGQRDLKKLRQDIMNDASILAQYTAPEPLLMDGAVKGFRLHLSNRLRLLYQIGFRPGDVVTELNGVRLNDPATVKDALYNFISSDQLSISVLRGQNEETFRYSFDD
ncbi:MAG: hypothetical protein CSB47_10615 [Proteobacteria bacterium]|nr:MAG: hypothetical protein CSB47_10615 [Pseudomonadota bacterium]